MTAALAGRVDGALASLDEGTRFALEARERDGLNYADIAAELDLGRERVADLLVAARLEIRSHLREAPLPPRRTPQCGPARRVMAAQQDGEAVGAGDVDRVREHLSSCAPCRDARRDLTEAAIACSAWRRTDPAELSPLPATDSQLLTVAGGQDRTDSRRVRLAVAAAAAVLAIVLLIAVLGGGGGDADAPAAPKPLPGSAQGSGKDVIPPPGDQFCAEGEQGCTP